MSPPPKTARRITLDDAGMAFLVSAMSVIKQASFISRAQDGLMIEVNSAWSLLTGISHDAAVGKTSTVLQVWGVTGQREQVLPQILEAASTFTYPSVTRNQKGQNFQVAVTTLCFKFGGVDHIWGLISDALSNPKISGDVLQKLNFIENLMTYSPAVLYQYRIGATGAGHFTYMSKSIFQLLGIQPEDVIKNPTVTFRGVNAEDLASMRLALQVSKTQLTLFRQEFQATNVDGTHHWLQADALPQLQNDGSTLWFGSLMDITAQKLAAHEAEDARHLLSTKSNDLEVTLENMDQGIFKEDQNGLITIFNTRLMEFLQLDKAQMLGIRTSVELMAFQSKRGDFGLDYELVEGVASDAFRRGDAKALPNRYSRRTVQGQVFEVKSRKLHDGGVVRTWTDVTHFHEAQVELEQNAERFRSLTDLTSEWYWETDTDQRITWIEGRVPSLKVGASPSQYLGKTRWEILGDLLSQPQLRTHRKSVAAQLPFRGLEFKFPNGGEKQHWYTISGAPFFDQKGVYQGYRGAGQRITEQKLQEKENLKLAFFDPLTGLPNRRLLTDRLEKALVSSARNKSWGALMFLDLDHFKDLNDTQGHDMGDLLLQQVAGRLLACIRESDTVCRFGGDEFVVVLEQLGPQPDRAADLARQVAQKVLTTLSDRYLVRTKTVFSASSIGLVLFDGREATGEELLKRADMAMYKAKSGGRNTLRFFDPEMQAVIDERSLLEADLRLGLERGEMLLYYQPVISNRGQIVGVEALVRWDSPLRGLVRPDFFIPVAEQSGLIVPIGRWVLETVCRQLVSWQSDAVAKSLSIAMNVSAREFHEPGFVEHMTAMLEKTGADPNQLKLELTEKLVLNDIDEAVEKMSRLRKLGVRFSLDDFGTGNSSLSYLKRLPLDEIKIDQSFVRDVLSDTNDAAIATTIVTLAHSLKLNVVAEGVESEGQCKFLLDQGCHAFQGYVFGRPLPVAQVSLTSFEKLFEATEPLYLSA